MPVLTLHKAEEDELVEALMKSVRDAGMPEKIAQRLVHLELDTLWKVMEDYDVIDEHFRPSTRKQIIRVLNDHNLRRKTRMTAELKDVLGIPLSGREPQGEDDDEGEGGLFGLENGMDGEEDRDYY